MTCGFLIRWQSFSNRGSLTRKFCTEAHEDHEEELKNPAGILSVQSLKFHFKRSGFQSTETMDAA
jgi:hypothetical protein